jgi:hypothetical protein
MHQGNLAMAGDVGLKVIRHLPIKSSVPGGPLTLGQIFKHGFPRPGQPAEVFDFRTRNCARMFRQARRVITAAKLGIPTFFGQLGLVVLRADGRWADLGLASMRVVTNAGVGYIVDCFQNLEELEDMKYHGIGTGTTSETPSDTALVTELTTQYDPDNTRATGTQVENGANVYQTVGTNLVDSGVAITEHGILDQAAVGGGVLLDRSVFSVINLGSGDSLQSTYDFTCTAGG